MVESNSTRAKQTNDSKVLDFEGTLNEIEEIVNEIENGQLPLQDLVDKFRQATNKIGECQKLLKETEQEIKVMEQSTLLNQKQT